MAAVLLSGCATVSRPEYQSIAVQAVFDHRPVANAGCIVSNAAGRWYVDAPGRVRVRRNAGPLAVDCRVDGALAGQDSAAARLGATGLWGNLVATAGLGLIVELDTGIGFEYPDTLTVILHETHAQKNAPAIAGAQGNAIY